MSDTPTFDPLRRRDITRMTSIESYIDAVIRMIERDLPADPRLTDAQELLEQAQAKVADYVDGIEASTGKDDLDELLEATSEGEAWVRTKAVRFVHRMLEGRDFPQRILQQQWVNRDTGERDWRDVPLEEE